MTERERFEQWASMPPRNWWTAREKEDDHPYRQKDEYLDDGVELAWQAWQARADASTHKAIHEDEV